MQQMREVTQNLATGLTNSNKLVIVVDTEDGEHMVEVTDIDALVGALRNLELVQMERRQWGAVDTGTTTTAEAELDRRAQ
jgi:hypothetical protein